MKKRFGAFSSSFKLVQIDKAAVRTELEIFVRAITYLIDNPFLNLSHGFQLPGERLY